MASVGARKKVAVACADRIGPVPLEPSRFARLRRQFQFKRLAGFLVVLGRDPEQIVIIHPERFDHLDGRDGAIADEDQIFPVLIVGRFREVIGTEIEPRSRLVEVQHHEFAVHPGSALVAVNACKA